LGNFIEYKKTYFGESKVFDCDLVYKDDEQREVVIAYRPEKTMHFVGVEFPIGSVSLGYYWKNRNYNVYHWKDLRGKTLLFYFNISKDTRIQENSVTWLDLIVDIAVKPEESPIVLDEDEVPKNIEPQDKRIIETTKKQILDNIKSFTDEIEARTASILKI